ncbi:hypothetical protein PENARI_c005G03429 [Penicillium arizonense]|uniref:Uncharacterized protein n=1 Tax=Penicillium arizonense TaxID=1835702 RepID=A0A1F5LNF6_PENAI|nr:hypothetical protein PENARI_c005G03429 [Penicillium arizonense]OGE54742.1 hypothetical protein PENARI_c005G03429 [Penicillium arizonense]
MHLFLPTLALAKTFFLRFLENLDKANEASKWIEVVFVAAGIVSNIPTPAAIAVGIVVQVIADTTRELQMRLRENKDTFLDQTVVEYSNSVITKPKFKQGLDSVRLVSGKTHQEQELSDAAALVYPDLDRVAAQAVRSEGDMGTTSGINGLHEKFQAAGELETEHPGSSLALSASAENRAPLKSLLDDPYHPANSGSMWECRGRSSGHAQKAETGVRMIKKLMQKDVLCLMVVNLPSQEETRESVAQLEHMMEQARDGSY